MMNILFYSRGYYSKLFPCVARKMTEHRSFHFVVNKEEQHEVEKCGGKVVLVLEEILKVSDNESCLIDQEVFSEMAVLTGFNFNPFFADRYLGNLAQDQVIRLSSILIKKLASVLEEYNISCVVHEAVSAFPVQVLLYLAKKRNLKYLLWVPSYIPGHIAFLSGITGEKFIPLKENRYGHSEIKEVVSGHFSRVQQDSGRPLYSVMKEDGSFLSMSVGAFVELLRFIKWRTLKYTFLNRGDFINAFLHLDLFWNFQCSLGKLHNIYDDISECSVDFDVFFPIHLEPEAVLLYWAPSTKNQIAFAEQLAISLPPNAKLWVKEHPQQAGALGTKGWRQLKKRIHNIRFVRAKESSRALVRRTKVTATITSTAGMDALVLGKEVAVFGDVYFDKYPGSHKFGGVEERLNFNGFSNFVKSKEHFIYNQSALESAFIKDFRNHSKAYPIVNEDLYTESSLDEIAEAFSSYLD